MISHWILAARIKTLPVSVCPILIALSLASLAGPINQFIAFLTLTAAILIQIGTNFANDYFDHKKGADTDERVGPLRMTQAGHITPEAMKLATFIAFGLAVLIGVYLVYYGGWAILAIGIAAVFFGVIYTAGPFALAYIGGAEIVAFAFFGPISVLGTFYLQTFNWNTNLLWISSAVGLITVALLVVNNTRDIETDKKVNKKTFAVRFGRLFSYLEYIVCLYAPILILDYMTPDSTEQLVLLLVLVALAMILSRRFGKAKDELFNKLLAYTSLYLILFTAITIYLFSSIANV